MSFFLIQPAQRSSNTSTFSWLIGEVGCQSERDAQKAHPPIALDGYSISRSTSSSSSLSSSSDTSDLTSVDSELDRNNELLKEEYQKYLKDQNDTKTNAILSKSFWCFGYMTTTIQLAKRFACYSYITATSTTSTQLLCQCNRPASNYPAG